MNIVLFGSCESTWYGSFLTALRENENIKALPFTPPVIHPFVHIYDFYRQVNQESIKKADLIIVTANENTFVKNDACQKHYLFVYDCFYKMLSKLQKKVIVIQWHHFVLFGGKHTYFHKIQCEKYGFNFIDAYDFCVKENLIDFYRSIDNILHALDHIYGKIGKEIVKNLEFFKAPKQVSNLEIPEFKVLDLSDFMDTKDKNLFCKARTYLYSESILKIEDEVKINFPKEYLGMKIIGVHTWNEAFTPKKFFSCYVFENKEQKNAISFLNAKSFRFLDYGFIIDGEIKIHNNFDESVKRPRWDWYKRIYENERQAGLIGFLLLDKDVNIEEVNFIDEDIDLPKEYDFSHLCSYLKDFKIIIEQYNERQDPIKLAPLQKKISDLTNEFNSLPVRKQNLELRNLEQDLVIKKLESKKLAKSLGIKMDVIHPKITFIQAHSAKARIQSQLSYKLGQALIENSKSLWGYLRMPYVLSYIKDKHEFEQKAYKTKIKEHPHLALPSLESYPDYKAALKEKECFTYKLGKALIEANKTWYKGGYLKFYFKDMPKLKREFKNKKT